MVDEIYFWFGDDEGMQQSSPNMTTTFKEGGPKLPYTFDVSTLLPVRRSNEKPLSKPPKIIELVDKGASEVVCCFRGVTKAHRALGIDRSVATMACLNYGTPSQPDMGSYILRYVLNLEGRQTE